MFSMFYVERLLLMELCSVVLLNEFVNRYLDVGRRRVL